MFNGWGVARFDPDGVRLEPIRFPAQTVTKAAFAGDDLRDLYCTTAWLGNADKRTDQPGLGGLYRVRVETPGLPQALARL
jgi:sugar lactone lactonase YvrE